MTAAFKIDPDLAIALDVDHATIPGSRPDTTVDGDSLCATIGPYIQPKLLQRLLDCAKEYDESMMGRDVEITSHGSYVLNIQLVNA